MNIEALDGVASARLIAALSKLDSDNGLENKKGLDELTALTKRSDDCTEVLDLMLQMGLVQKLLSFLSGKSVPDSQLVPVKGLAAEALLLPLGQALQVAALAALGELIWQRDTASDFRPVLQAQGGLAVLGTLEARDSQLLGAIAGLVPRALDPDDASVTSSSLEGDALMAVRELAWDDHNKVVEPGISCMAEAGVFDALAGLLTRSPGSSPGKSPEAIAAAEGASISKAVADSACAMLERLAAAPEGSLAPGLAAQVPRLLHQVISHLVKQLDTAQHAPERQDAALSALRKLLVTENSQSIPPAAAEAADAEGVPSRLRSVALSSEAFGGQGGWGKGDGAPESTAAAAAALLADLTVSSSLSAAYGGRPAQAAESLREVEPVVEQLMAGLDHDVEASRNFCQALYKLSLIRYDEAVEGDGQEPDTRLSGPHWQHAPPESEQYELTSQLVTMVGHAATGLTLLLLANQSKPQAAAIPRVKAGGPAAAPGSPGLQAPAASSAGEAAGNEVASTPRGPDRLLERLQRASLLMHELAGLKPLVNSRPLSYHNIDALFVHGTCQALLQGMGSYYNAQRAAAKALQRAAIMAASASNDADSPSMQEEASGLQHAVDAALAAAEETEDLSLSENGLQGEAEGAGGGRGTLQLQSSFMLPQLSPSRYASFAQSSNPLLQPLLHHETGALELMKEVVRDYDGARLKLRDIGALHLFARMLGDNLRDNLLVSLQFNLARSEALHSALKQEGCVQLMAKVLAQAPQMDGAQHEVRRLLALITLGLVASDEILTSSAQGGGAAEAAAGARQALALLDKHDLPGMMERVMRDACRDGRFVISSTTAWPFMLEPAALTVQCLARSPTYARRLADKKIPAMLLGALRNKHGSQPQVALWLVRALLNFARLPDLRPALLAADCLETLLPYTAWDDLRVADAARGCLLQLGELPDLPCKLALQSSLPEAVQPSMSQPLPPTSPSSPAPPVEPVVDVLISYKRQDAHAFARMLHTLLITRGVSCLLDFEYGQDLSDVRQVVSRCRNLVVVLTDNVLTSPRCLEEMEAAVRCDVNTVTVVKEGARGNMVGFPPQPTLRLLQPEVQKVFALKPLHHRPPSTTPGGAPGAGAGPAVDGDAAAVVAAAVVAGLAREVSSLRDSLAAQVASSTQKVAEDLGREMAALAQQGVQGLVKSLAASSLRSSGGPDAYNMSASMRMAPYIMTATHPEGAIFHSTPLDATSPPPDLPHGMSASMPSLNAMLAANSNGAMLPPIANGYNGSPGHGERQSRNPHKGSGGPGSGGGAGGGNGTAASNTTPGGVLGPAAVTPHVGGFQGARIAAQQARLTAISGRTMAVKH
ncbi:TIR domain-containing protein [Haematococcus lacustris]|uniref:TIR domain-containing protein n=1 Tax=Haematococcus lacustris TaxID=44745 RepID=A0A699Z1P9_HAELA|nr:TIR domain-containing protein [Haematococcus lacustris]